MKLTAIFRVCGRTVESFTTQSCAFMIVAPFLVGYEVPAQYEAPLPRFFMVRVQFDAKAVEAKVILAIIYVQARSLLHFQPKPEVLLSAVVEKVAQLQPQL